MIELICLLKFNKKKPYLQLLKNGQLFHFNQSKTSNNKNFEKI